MSDWHGWHPVTNHSLLLYAVACWTSDGGGMEGAQERSESGDEMHKPRSVIA